MKKKKDWSQEGERAFGGGEFLLFFVFLSSIYSWREMGEMEMRWRAGANTRQMDIMDTYTTASRNQAWVLVARMGRA